MKKQMNNEQIPTLWTTPWRGPRQDCATGTAWPKRGHGVAR
jgi:hypothetical protein